MNAKSKIEQYYVFVHHKIVDAEQAFRDRSWKEAIDTLRMLGIDTDRQHGEQLVLKTLYGEIVLFQDA